MRTLVYILAGQSNAVGLRSRLEAELTETYGSGGYRLVTVAVGATGLLRPLKRPDWATANELPQRLVDKAADVMATLPKAGLRGMLWVQGEADTIGGLNAAPYKALLSLMFDKLRAEVPGAEGLPVTLVGLSADAQGRNGRKNWDAVMEAQAELAAEDPRLSLLSPDEVVRDAGFPASKMFHDKLHYSGRMLKILAEAGLDRMIDAHQERIKLPHGPATRGDDIFGPDGAAAKMAGGKGDDTYYVDRRGDSINERRGEGDDTVIASVSFSLRTDGHRVESLMLAGTDDLNGFGNALDNSIIGNTGANRLKGGQGNDVLRGGEGNDRLFGEAGADHLLGGPGDDLYVITDRRDVVFESRDQGHDTVRARVSFTLRDHSQEIEDLRLAGRNDLNGFGNARDNLIKGNRGDNRLDGAWGDDRLTGKGGDDRLADRHGDDIYTGGSGADHFVFERDAGHDRVTDFKPGKDSLVFIDLTARRDLSISQQGDDTVIGFGEGAQVVLDDVDAQSLRVGDFLFL
ncbi:sialate O-acetylesterase [Chachezhania antarctica]|uniref:sialate O-acetylesterase n=1 Tax=Chachezhania antarctica TaxID=2340860 RepID=UPI0013CE8B68|nr:sialate O-acetylesterase [Chachezhania antarctica]